MFYDNRFTYWIRGSPFMRLYVVAVLNALFGDITIIVNDRDKSFKACSELMFKNSLRYNFKRSP